MGVAEGVGTPPVCAGWGVELVAGGIDWGGVASTAGGLAGDSAGLACEEFSSAGIDGDGDAVWALPDSSKAQAVTIIKDQRAPWMRGEVIIFVVWGLTTSLRELVF